MASLKRIKNLTLADTSVSRLSPKNQMACMGCTYVAGFWDWKRLGRSVCKGAKGISVLAPIGADSDGEMRFRGVYVFDISQTREIGGKG